MFSFHKPKIYRSVNGCCICKAKSSSSRFTDSKKYEPEFDRCFSITEKRSGEICNACVLLVKRCRKLPPGTDRNWHHVVDARAGPGTKSSNKPKNKKTENQEKKFIKEKLERIPSSGGLSDDVMVCDDSLSESSNLSLSHSQAPSPSPSNYSEDSGIIEEQDEELEKEKPLQKRKCNNPQKLDKLKVFQNTLNFSFIDTTYWQKEKTCCGTIYRGPNNEVLIYPMLLHPCTCNNNTAQEGNTLKNNKKSSGGLHASFHSETRSKLNNEKNWNNDYENESHSEDEEMFDIN